MVRADIERFNNRPRRTSWLRLATLVLIPTLAAAGSGCTAAVSIGVKLIGSAVDDADVKKHSEKLLGAELAAADEVFGERIDTLRDVNSTRAWVIYPVKDYNILGKDRYVVEAVNDRIVAFSRVEKTSDAKTDIPRALIIADKVKGKPIGECEALLENVGPLLVTARRESTNTLSQLYDGRLIKDFGKPHYCILRFDENKLCSEVEFIGVGASSKEVPISP
ncbi:MAG: hypothetical protein O7D94_13020 [Planctomycetota bacterium]|nr:hypothetical protein [Planctomycetota bacterium]